MHELQVHQIELELQSEELLEAHLALEAARDHFSDLYDLAPVGYLTLDRLGLIREANLTIAGWLETPRQKLIGRQLARMVAEKDRDTIYLHLKRLVETREPQSCEVALILPDPYPRIVQLDSRSERTATDDLRVRTTLTDISHLRTVELRATLLGNVIEKSSEAIMITDSATVIKCVNDAFTRITGYTAEEVIGEMPRILSSGRQDKAFYKSMWADLNRTGYWQGEIFNRRRNGDIYPEFMTITAIKNDDGHVDHYVAIFSDISRIRQREEKLRAINAELEEFAYVTSHDLREPLRMISSYMGLIQRHYGQDFDDREREYFAFVQDGAKRMDALIRDVLTYSRIGRHENAFTSVDIHSLMSRVIDSLGPFIAEAGAEIIVHPDLPHPLAEENEIERVFTNLLENALKYRRPDQAPRIAVGGRVEGGRALFTISDNGIGIEPQYQERIFRMFQRLHEREAYGGGTGIGLAVCQKVIDSHGGRIWVQSKPGEGSTFSFTLPLEH
ncbi:hypothetical protein JCM17960_20080 [Magnetospira thiophila]